MREVDKLNNEVLILKSIVRDQDQKIAELEKRLEEQPKQIVEKIRSYFDVPEDMKFLANYCEDDIIISESDFIEFLDNLIKEYYEKR